MSTLTPSGLALFGADPVLPRRLPLGQRNFPSWTRYEAAFRDIFARQYYTNHGPLAQALEARLAARLNVRHAMCVTTAGIGLALAAQALGLKGKVVVPALSYVGTAQSLAWANVSPAFCDVSRDTGHITIDTVTPLLSQDVTGILGVNLWGSAFDVDGIAKLADSRGIPLYIDSSHGFGCEIAGKPIGGFGRLEVISFHAAHILGAAEGAVMCTDDDDLAAHVRNIRSNYGSGRPVPVGKTSNGRLSEAQAAIALMNLDDMPELMARNERLYETYGTHLSDIPGLRVVAPAGVNRSNHETLVCRIDAQAFGLTRDALIAALAPENIEARGDHGLGVQCHAALATGHALGNTQHWCESVLQLPLGAGMDEQIVERIAERIRVVQRHAGDIAAKLGA
jgi:dTDP-4-amino-4,6-dideoxygalactose transaminase